MGCDIHTFSEVKINGTWHLYNQPDVGRYYELFGKLAGVRSTIKPIVAPRGFPQDASLITKMENDYWGVDGHTHSWLTEKELDKIKQWLGEDGQTMEQVFGWELFPHYEVEDKRLVFWFDN